jgi:hypothetical protein
MRFGGSRASISASLVSRRLWSWPMRPDDWLDAVLAEVVVGFAEMTTPSKACGWRIVISLIIRWNFPSCYDSVMRDLVVLFIHSIASLARLLGPGGARSLVAESLLLKHQLLILNRSRQRAPNLSASDRILAGWLALWLRPTRLLRSAIVLKPSTLIGLHQAMCKQKYRMLFSITIANPARRDRVQNSSTRSSK